MIALNTFNQHKQGKGIRIFPVTLLPPDHRCDSTSSMFSHAKIIRVFMCST